MSKGKKTTKDDEGKLDQKMKLASKRKKVSKEDDNLDKEQCKQKKKAISKVIKANDKAIRE